MASAAPQKNKRLSNHDRGVIKGFARKQIEATQDHSELDAAYDAVAAIIQRVIHERWPVKDMQVLARYDAASIDRCIQVGGNGSAYDYSQFEFREDDKRAPIRPNWSCRNYPIQLDGADAYLFSTYARLLKAHREQVRARAQDFYALIDNTAGFNALVEVWPAVDALRGEIVGHGASLSVLSSEVVDRLKADPALELAA